MSPRPVSPLILLRDRLLAADPGGVMLRFSLRATLTVALAIAAEAGIARLLGQPVLSFVIGAIVAMMATMAVRDPTPLGKVVTTLLIPLGASVSITIAAFSTASPFLGPALFVVVMFVAVWMRRFGLRWDAVGMAAFMAYFFTLYVGATPAQLPWMYLSLLIGIVASLFVRLVLVRDRPLDLRRIMPALRAQVRLILYDLGRIVRHRRTARNHRRIARRVMELNEVVLMLREQEDEEARRALFEAELAVQRLDTLAGRERPPGENEAILHDLRALYLAPATPEGRRIAWRTGPDERFGSALRRLVDALDDPALHRTEDAAPDGQDAQEAPDAPKATAAPTATAEAKTADDATTEAADAEEATVDEGEPRDDGTDPRGLLPTTRTAIQTAAAGVLAIVAGQWLQPGMWHWAVITAFLVFTGTNSRGAVLVKGWRRVIGTVAGVIGGVALVAVIGDNRTLSVALILLSVFAGFYLIRSSYAGMMFWITVMIALLYDLMGLPGLEMLQIRAEETLLGALIGVLIAAFLLPTRTKPIVEDEGRKLLQALGDVIEGARQRLTGEEGEAELLARVRAMDQAFQSLRQAGEPLSIRPPGARPRPSERWLVVLPLLVYEAHALVRRTNTAAAEQGTPRAGSHAGLLDAWQQATSRLQDRIEPLAQAIGSGRASALSDATIRRAAKAPWPGEGQGEGQGEGRGDGAGEGPDEAPPSSYHVPEGTGPAIAKLARSLARIDWIVTVLAEGIDSTGTGVDGPRRRVVAEPTLDAAQDPG